MTADSPVRPTCFVIQTFDGGKYDRRYKETIRPALLRAEVEPQRADEILGLNPVIEKIEEAIEAAEICVAEVSEDNPNVWLELGYALALNRPTVILCDKERRSSLPFDIQHRPVVFYRTDSRSGYDDLDKSLVKWVKNELSRASRVRNIKVLRPGGQSKTDLEEYEVAALSAAFAFFPTVDGGITQWNLEEKLEKLGFSEVALALAVTGLMDRGFLSEQITTDYNHNEYKVYSVTKEGVEWIHENKDLLAVHESEAGEPSSEESEIDEDIPF